MDINEALRQFEATEANVSKLERLFGELRHLTPDGIFFGGDIEYDEKARAYRDVLLALPQIDSWKPDAHPIDLNDLARWRLDARELGEPTDIFAADDAVDEPARQLADYKHRLNNKRRPLIRQALLGAFEIVEASLKNLKAWDTSSREVNEHVSGADWDRLKDGINSIDMLLGSNLARPHRWIDLGRHIHFGMVQDLRDIIELDWPEAKKGLSTNLYAEDEPLPVTVADLGTLAASHPAGQVITRLKWGDLSDDDFERLIFTIISTTPGYENAEWLTRTNAPDRGRDLAVVRVKDDSLGGVTHSRVIIQCKHWLTKSVSPSEVATLRAQMELWSSPRVEVLVIATTGRFTTDAVHLIEEHNAGDRALKIEMWPDSHLERILARRPDLVAQFRLR